MTIARYKIAELDINGCEAIEEDTQGDYVSFADHQAALAEKDAEIDCIKAVALVDRGKAKKEYIALLAQTITFAEWCTRFGINPGKRAKAKAFLDQHRKGASHE